MKHKVKEVARDVFALVVSNDYDRAMLFWRVQEFYESPCPRFRASSFSVWDYAKWYAGKYEGSFSYPADFVGFNVPMIVAKKCYEMNLLETPYDVEMSSIVDRLFVNGRRQYLIGAESLKGDTFDHEMAHALYYTDIGYRNAMDEVTDSLPKAALSQFRKNLAKVGYHRGVIKDEIQAYMATELSERVCKGIRGRKEIHRRYKRVFRRFR